METKWQEQFKDEFGIHFSESELQFAVSFIEDLLEKENMEVRNKFTQVVAGMPGRLFLLPPYAERVVGYVREDGIGDIAYKGKEIDLMTVVNETLALTPTKTDKEDYKE